MIIIGNRNKKAKVNTEKFQRWTDEDDTKKKKKPKDSMLCQHGDCQNLHMINSNVCVECYQLISNEMSKTVKKKKIIKEKDDEN